MDLEELIALLDSGELQFAPPTYDDGAPMLAGDKVLAFHGEKPGVVTSVYSTKAEALENGLEYTGVFVEIGEHCFYLGMEGFLQDPLKLVARATAA